MFICKRPARLQLDNQRLFNEKVGEHSHRELFRLRSRPSVRGCCCATMIPVGVSGARKPFSQLFPKWPCLRNLCNAKLCFANVVAQAEDFLFCSHFLRLLRIFAATPFVARYLRGWSAEWSAPRRRPPATARWGGCPPRESRHRPACRGSILGHLGVHQQVHGLAEHRRRRTPGSLRTACRPTVTWSQVTSMRFVSGGLTSGSCFKSSGSPHTISFDMKM